jgi:hypothetical protein
MITWNDSENHNIHKIGNGAKMIIKMITSRSDNDGLFLVYICCIFTVKYIKRLRSIFMLFLFDVLMFGCYHIWMLTSENDNIHKWQRKKF